MADQYCGGCYTMTMPPGILTRYGPYLRQSIGRLHFAGSEVATEWSGYINGAIQAGERTARQILANLDRLDPSQVDQIEPVSVDYPPVPFVTTFFERYAPSASGFLFGAAVATLGVATLGGVAYWTIKNRCWDSSAVAYCWPLKDRLCIVKP